MKRIDLFQLMNAFQDEEFEPEEECFVDENKVKETVLTQVRQKKRKGRKVLVLAGGPGRLSGPGRVELWRADHSPPVRRTGDSGRDRRSRIWNRDHVRWI